MHPRHRWKTGVEGWICAPDPAGQSQQTTNLSNRSYGYGFHSWTERRCSGEARERPKGDVSVMINALAQIHSRSSQDSGRSRGGCQWQSRAPQLGVALQEFEVHSPATVRSGRYLGRGAGCNGCFHWIAGWRCDRWLQRCAGGRCRWHQRTRFRRYALGCRWSGGLWWSLGHDPKVRIQGGNALPVDADPWSIALTDPASTEEGTIAEHFEGIGRRSAERVYGRPGGSSSERNEEAGRRWAPSRCSLRKALACYLLAIARLSPQHCTGHDKLPIMIRSVREQRIFMPNDQQPHPG